jgi:cytochrome c-type biogenesis protein CcmH/NrfF
VQHHDRTTGSEVTVKPPSTERNWALWGRVDTAARNALSLERAKKLMTVRLNSRAQEEANMEDCALLLSVLEGELVDAMNGQG